MRVRGKKSKPIRNYNSETGTITAFASSWEEVETDTNFFENVYHGWLVDISVDGKILDIREISMPENTVTNIRGGAVTKDSLIYLYRTTARRSVCRLDLTTGETISSEDTAALKQDEIAAFDLFAVDEEGMIYGSDTQTVYVLNPDLTLLFSYDFPSAIYTMARGADGAVWVVLNVGMEAAAAQIDIETKQLGEYRIFERGSGNLTKVSHDLLNAPMTAGTHEFYYFESTALWGVTVEEDGSLTEERMVDFFNSGIPQPDKQTIVNDTDTLAVAMLSDDLLLTIKRGRNECGQLTIHRRSADVNLDEVQSITVAHACELTPESIDRMLEFGRKNPDIRVITLDYSVYATEEDPLAGEDRLCFDLLNGGIEPDIVVTDATIQTVADNSVMRQLTKNNLYVDLLPYLEADDEINTDTIFDCIPRMFDDGKGGMWGIATDFTMTTLYAGRETLGAYAEQKSWTAEEMFDFFDSLADDAEAYYGYTLRIPVNQIFAQGYQYFIGNDGSSFSTDTFTRYLEFIRDAPADVIERNKTSPYVNLNSEELRGALLLGKIGVSFTNFSSPMAADNFRMLIGEDYHPIGYATKTESGIRVNAEQAYVITTYADDPSACFELLKTFFVPQNFNISNSALGEWNIFALKEEVIKYMQMYTSVWSVSAMLTTEELAAVFDIIDGAGIPLLTMTPTAIDEIVKEEVSAYLAGVGTAEACAQKIQSRVDIWIAEHE